MQYKTIVLGLLEDLPEIKVHLLRERTMLQILDTYASSLRESHETWKENLREQRPGSSESQLSSEAMELAIQDLEEMLSSIETEEEYFPLDDAMKFIRRHTPPE